MIDLRPMNCRPETWTPAKSLDEAIARLWPTVARVPEQRKPSE